MHVGIHVDLVQTTNKPSRHTHLTLSRTLKLRSYSLPQKPVIWCHTAVSPMPV